MVEPRRRHTEHRCVLLAFESDKKKIWRNLVFLFLQMEPLPPCTELVGVWTKCHTDIVFVIIPFLPLLFRFVLNWKVRKEAQRIIDTELTPAARKDLSSEFSLFLFSLLWW